MASKNFSGILRDPLGTLANNDKYRFTHVSTTGEVIRGSTSYLTIGDDGVYNIDIEYGNVSIESYSELGKRWIAQGTTTINADTTATTLPALLNALVPASDALILQLEALLADAESAATSAVSSAAIATDAASSASTDAASASTNAAIATDAATSATASASSAASDAQTAVNAATSANTSATIATNAATSAESDATSAADSATTATQAAAAAAQDAADIKRQFTTSQLIFSNLTYIEVGDTIETNGFATAGDGGGAQWLLTSEAGTPSQTPAELGDTKFTDGDGRVWSYVGDTVKVLAIGDFEASVRGGKGRTVVLPTGDTETAGFSIDIGNGDSLHIVGTNRAESNLVFTSDIGVKANITQVSDFRDNPTGIYLRDFSCVATVENTSESFGIYSTTSGTSIGIDLTIERMGFKSNGGGFLKSLDTLGISKGTYDNIRMQGTSGIDMGGIFITGVDNGQVPVDNTMNDIKMQSMTDTIVIYGNTEGAALSKIFLVGCQRGVNIDSGANRHVYFSLSDSHINCVEYAVNISGQTRGYIASNVLIYVNDAGLLLERADQGHCYARFVNQSIAERKAVTCITSSMTYFLGGEFYGFDNPFDIATPSSLTLSSDLKVYNHTEFLDVITNIQGKVVVGDKGFGSFRVETDDDNHITFRALNDNVDLLDYTKNVLSVMANGVRCLRVESVGLSSENNMPLGSPTLPWGVITTDKGFNFGANKVVGERQPAIADASVGSEANTINSVLAALRAHGLIET